MKRILRWAYWGLCAAALLVGLGLVGVIFPEELTKNWKLEHGIRLGGASALMVFLMAGCVEFRTLLVALGKSTFLRGEIFVVPKGEHVRFKFERRSRK